MSQYSDGPTPLDVFLIPFSVDDRILNEVDCCSEAMWTCFGVVFLAFMLRPARATRFILGLM